MKTTRVYSDLHQEFKEDSFFTIAESGDEENQNLVLAGDIYHLSHLHKKEKGAFYDNFYSNLSSRFNKVMIVFGNHDFYGSKLAESYILKFHEYLKKYDNVFLLSRFTPSVEDDDTVFIGAPLWTDFGGKNPALIPHRKYDTETNDFKYITYISKQGYTKYKPLFWINEFTQDFNWIKKETEKFKDKNIFMVTHFAPSSLSYDYEDPKGEGIIYYKSNLDDFILNNPHIKYWVHGHIHTPNDLFLGNTHIYSNPIGYDKKFDDKPECSFVHKASTPRMKI